MKDGLERGSGMRMLRIAGVGLASLMVLGAIRGGGEALLAQLPMQQPMQQQPTIPGQPSNGHHLGDDDPLAPQIAEKQEKSRNSERQKRLEADTDRLLALATNLKEEVNQSNKDISRMDVGRKAEEIEKLAHSVKERMKG